MTTDVIHSNFSGIDLHLEIHFVAIVKSLRFAQNGRTKKARIVSNTGFMIR
jgi:hypothetical protein